MMSLLPTPKEGNTDQSSVAASRSTNVPSRSTQSFADRRAEVLNKDHTSDTNSDDDAGLCLYVTRIALSAAMAAFVCRRMVYALWSSLNNEESAVMDVEQQEKEDYSSIKKVDSGLIQRLAISSSNKEEEVAEVGEIDEIIPEATIGGKEE